MSRYFMASSFAGRPFHPDDERAGRNRQAPVCAPAALLPWAARRMLETTLRPRPPYSLALSARGPDATRRVRDGVLSLAFEAGGEPARALVWQRVDGSLGVVLDGPPEEGL